LSQLEVLQNIEGLLSSMPQYANGGVVAQTGLAHVDKGEIIISPANDIVYGGGNVISFEFNMQGVSGDPDTIARKTREEFEEMLDSSVGRKLIQDIARGH